MPPAATPPTPAPAPAPVPTPLRNIVRQWVAPIAIGAGIVATLVAAVLVFVSMTAPKAPVVKPSAHRTAATAAKKTIKHVKPAPPAPAAVAPTAPATVPACNCCCLIAPAPATVPAAIAPVPAAPPAVQPPAPSRSCSEADNYYCGDRLPTAVTPTPLPPMFSPNERRRREEPVQAPFAPSGRGSVVVLSGNTFQLNVLSGNGSWNGGSHGYGYGGYGSYGSPGHQITVCEPAPTGCYQRWVAH